MKSEQTIYKKVIFVGGYPRSGTTVTHALLCTSKMTVPYHPEVSYLKFIFQSYQAGINNWDNHTQHLFESMESYRQHFHDILSLSFSYLRKKLGDHEVLCIKDPLLTPYFHWVAHLMGDNARFVSVIRHPFDVIRSNIEVQKRMGKGQTSSSVEALGIQYMNFYAHLDNPTLQTKLHAFRYEDLQDSETIKNLRSFTGLSDIAPQDVWKDAKPLKESQNPWFSPKYNSPIDIKPRLDVLDDEYKEIVGQTCIKLMQRFNYS